MLTTFIFTSSALGAAASVGLGTAARFSVLGGSTVTNTGPTTMWGDLGLSPGSSVTGAPHVLGQTHVDDAVAIAAKNDLTTAYNDAASRPSNGSAGTDLAGQVFLPGVRTASSSLLLSSGSVTLDAQGNPDAVFIFQIGSTLITGSNTSVSLVNGAQACNVFWQVGSSATLGTGTSFVGTIMALESITATTAATIHGRLLARTAAVTLDTNTITTSNCASSVSGERRWHRNAQRRAADRNSACGPLPADWIEDRLTLGRGQTRGANDVRLPGVQHDGAQLPGARQTAHRSRGRRCRTGEARSPDEHESAQDAERGCCWRWRAPAWPASRPARRPARALRSHVQATQELVVLRAAPHCALRRRTPARRRWRWSRPPADHRRATTLPVLARSIAAGGVRWLQVMLAGRPDGLTGWIAQHGHPRARDTVADRAEPRRPPRDRVQRDGRRVKVFRAVVGKPSTPTPTGEFFVEEVVRMNVRRARRPVRAGSQRPLERVAGIRRRARPDRDTRT